MEHYLSSSPLGPDEKPKVVARTGLRGTEHQFLITQDADGTYHAMLALHPEQRDTTSERIYLASLWNSNYAREGLPSVNLKDVAAVAYHREGGMQFLWAEQEGKMLSHSVRLHYLTLAAQRALWERLQRRQVPFSSEKTQSDHFELMRSATWALDVITGIADNVHNAERARL